MLHVITVKQRNIDSVIDRVNKHYGGIEGYLASAGFDISRTERFQGETLYRLIKNGYDE